MGLPLYSPEQRRYVSCPRPANYAKRTGLADLGRDAVLSLGDGLPRPTGNMCSPGTEIVYEGKQYNGHCLNSNSKTYGKDEWVKAERSYGATRWCSTSSTGIQCCNTANRQWAAVLPTGTTLLSGSRVNRLPKVTLPCRVKGNRSHFATCFLKELK